MSEQTPAPATPSDDSHKHCCGRHHRHHCHSGPYRWVRLFLIAGLIGAAIFMHHRHCGDGRFFSHNSATPAVMQAHAERAAEHVANRVDATDAQRTALVAASKDFAAELQPLIAAHRAARTSIYTALSADHIDATQLEQARSALVQQLDTSSRQLTSSLVKAGESLNPAQRRELLSHWQTAAL